jgi:uncharacterized protein YuzE
MVVEYDTEGGAFYVRVTDEAVARTVEVATLVSVDVDAENRVVGLELLCLPSAVTADERAALGVRYPLAIDALTESSASRAFRPELPADWEVDRRVAEPAFPFTGAREARDLLSGSTEIHRAVVGTPIAPVPNAVGHLHTTGPGDSRHRCPGSNDERQFPLSLTGLGPGGGRHDGPTDRHRRVA